jgi:hypothetical protein
MNLTEKENVMKTKLLTALATLGLLTSVVAFAEGTKTAAGCTSSPSAMASTEAEPVVMFANQTVLAPADAVAQFVEAINAGDMTAAQLLLTSDAWYAYGSGEGVSGQGFVDWLQSDIFGVNGNIAVAEQTLEDTVVTLTGQYTSDGWSGNFTYVFTVRDGLIESWQLL